MVTPEKVSARCRAAVNSLYKHDHLLFNSVLEKTLQKKRSAFGLSDSILLRAVGALGAYSQMWKTLQESDKDRILLLLRTANLDKLKECESFASFGICDSRIEMALSKRREELLSTYEGLKHLLDSVTHGHKYLVPHVISYIERAVTFRDAEERLRDFNNLSPFITNDDLDSFGDAVRSNNQVYLANGTESILMNICTNTSALPNAAQMWKKIANGLNDDYLNSCEPLSTPSFSYKNLVDFVRATFD